MLRRILQLLAAALVLGVLAGAYRYQMEEQRLRAPMPLDEATEFEVRAGASLAQVANRMRERGLLDSPRFLVWYARLAGKARGIKAGTYLIEPGASALDALEQFIEGREVQYAFTIVEGWSFAELRRALQHDPRLVQTLDDVADGEVMSVLGRPGTHPEGMFLAETYHYSPGSEDVSVLRRAMDALERRLQGAWERRAPELPLRSPYEALILASIIEKETGIPEERALIAGVFVERLRRGMRLQTDPTVIYGLGDSFDGNLRRRDLERDTPYNTYTRAGLPPTPIALAGAAAIEAALRPRVDGSLFFVARGDGRHHFSRNYAEHRKAVERYQLRRPAAGGAKGG